MALVVGKASEIHRGAWEVCRCINPCREKLFYDLFSGPEAPLAQAFRKLGWAVRSFEIKAGGPSCDLLRPAVRAKIFEECRACRPDAVFQGPPCRSVSSWNYTNSWFSRSVDRPWGDGKHIVEVVGNALLRASLLFICFFDSIKIPCALEQPRASLMWRIPEFIGSLASQTCYQVTFDWCHFGRPWPKRSTVKGRFAFLPSLERRCPGGHQHFVVHGPFRDPISQRYVRESEAVGQYSAAFCGEFARVMPTSPLEPRERHPPRSADLRVRVEVVTAARYSKQLVWIRSWCVANSLGYLDVLAGLGAAVMVPILIAFVQGLYAAQAPITHAMEGLAAMQMCHPILK